MALTFLRFLRALRRASIRAGRRIVVITDNARYHHARLHKDWREAAPGLALGFLPAYSPELNPIERVWKLTRRLCLQIGTLPQLDEVIAAVESRVRRVG